MDPDPNVFELVGQYPNLQIINAQTQCCSEYPLNLMIHIKLIPDLCNDSYK